MRPASVGPTGPCVRTTDEVWAAEGTFDEKSATWVSYNLVISPLKSLSALKQVKLLWYDILFNNVFFYHSKVLKSGSKHIYSFFLWITVIVLFPTSLLLLFDQWELSNDKLCTDTSQYSPGLILVDINTGNTHCLTHLKFCLSSTKIDWWHD